MSERYEWLGNTPKDAWMETSTGGKIHIFDPQPGEIRLEDIVHACGYTCRYGGHCKTHYSVAQHSVHVADVVKDRGGNATLQLQALLHDAAEAYIGDLPRPVKMWMSQFQDLDAYLTGKIMEVFGVPLQNDDLPHEIHYVDRNICHDEGKVLLKSGPGAWWSNLESFGLEIDPWGPSVAKHVMRRRIQELMMGQLQ